MTRGTSINKADQAVVSLLSIRIVLPGCSSLKEKRSRLQSLLNRLRKEFNAGFSETALQDLWQSALISCVMVSNDGHLNQKMAEEILRFIESHFPDEIIEEYHLEHR